MQSDMQHIICQKEMPAEAMLAKQPFATDETVTVHGEARGTDPFSRANVAFESRCARGRCLFFAVKMRQSPTRERLR